MTRSIALAAALALGATLPSIAIAQSPPGGFVAALTPGGTEGIAGPANVAQAIRGGTARVRGTTVETSVGPMITGSIDHPSEWSSRPGRSSIR